MKATEHDTQFIRVQPICGAEPLMCNINVQKRIKAMGGSAAYGWCVRHDKFNDCWQNHCVWESPEGELIDVTPVFSNVFGEYAVWEWPERIEFVRDDSATFSEKALPTRYVPTLSNPYLEKACEYMNIADEHLRNNDLERCRYWTGRANQSGRKLGIFWESPASADIADTLRTMLA